MLDSFIADLVLRPFLQFLKTSLLLCRFVNDYAHYVDQSILTSCYKCSLKVGCLHLVTLGTEEEPSLLIKEHT